jgi:hypothetical protein
MKTETHQMTRREAVRDLMLGSLALWVDWRPSKEFSRSIMGEAEYEDKTIRAFINTIVPGTDVSHPQLTTIFRDPYFGFGKVRWLFNFNLRKRSLSRFGTLAFHKLSEADRIKVIQSGLQAENKISQLYSAAIFASQLTVFTGFYMEKPKCDLIEFEEGFNYGEVCYPDGQKYFQHSITADGNFQ